jgi:ubiquinone biosynthesis monooxygenase Coq7
LGKEGAMACTVAVETVIIDHYNDQIRALLKNDPHLHEELISILSSFRDEEQEHHDIGLEHGAEQAPAYKLMTFLIKQGCKTAIFISEKA